MNETLLLQQRAAELQAAEAIMAAAGTNALTAEQSTALDNHMASVDAIDANIARAKKLAALRPASAGLEQPAVPQGSGARVHDNRGDAPFANLGEMMVCVRTAAMLPGEMDPRLQKRAALGMNESVGADGGFLVGKDVSNELLEEVHDVGMIAPLCRELPISSESNAITINGVDETSRADGSRWGGVQAYWADEAGTATATKPKFIPMDLKLKKLLAFYYATDEVLRDASALSAEAQAAFSEEIAFKLDDAIIRGNGAGQPLGILNATALLVSVAKETGQLAGTVQFENIVKMYARMPARSKARATWFINDDVMPQLQLRTIAAGAANVPVYLPPNGAAAAPFGTLLGRPIMPIEQAESVGTVGDIILGDFAQYRLATKGGLEQAASVHVAFLTSEQVFRFTYRVDGQPARRTAITPYKGAATKSPFVVLATRA